MRTKMLLISSLFFAGLFLFSCHKNEQELQIIIKNDNAKVITGDTIQVSINTTHQTLIDVYYSIGSVRYQRQINQGDIELLNNEKDYKLVSSGNNEYGNSFQKVVITTSFSDTIMIVGATVKITAMVGTDMAESVFYKVIE